MEIMSSVLILLFSVCAANAQIVAPRGITAGVADGRFVNVTGDTMTGPLTVAGSSLTVTGAGEIRGNASVGGRVGGAVARFQIQGANTDTVGANTSDLAGKDGIWIMRTGTSNDFNLDTYYVGGSGAGFYNTMKSLNGAVSFPGSSFSVGTSTLVVSGGLVGFSAYTIAQFDAINPGAAGRMATCTNCTAPYRICVSTGTGRGSFVNEGTTDHCQ